MRTADPPRGRFAGEGIHLPFLAIALLIAVFGGFVLAIMLPVEIALGRVGGGWAARVQVHGHLQTVGCVGLFIMGVAYRLVPRFAGRPLPYPALVAPSFWLVAGGVLVRAVVQPLASEPWFGALLAAAGWAQAVGAACFAANVIALAAPSIRQRQEYAPFLAAGAAWFALQATLGAVWLTELALEGGTVLAADRNGVLLALQVFGFHLAFLFGVGLRSFPTFFGVGRIAFAPAAAGAAAFHGGLALIVLAGLIAVLDARPAVIDHIGAIAVGGAILWLGALTRWWRLPTRLRPASRPFAWTLQPAMAWLALAGVLQILFALEGLFRGAPVDPRGTDAVRHIIEIGVILLAIVGMAQMVLPEFAAERLRGPQARWRSAGFGVALSLAALLRAGARFVAPPLPHEVAYWLMAVAGVVGFVAIIAFAFLLARSVRRHRALLAQMTIPLGEVR
jgi:hypothetical protein